MVEFENILRFDERIYTCMPYGNSGSEASVPQYRSLRTTTATVVATNTDPVLVDAGLLLAGQDKHQKCLFLISE